MLFSPCKYYVLPQWLSQLPPNLLLYFAVPTPSISLKMKIPGSPYAILCVMLSPLQPHTPCVCFPEESVDWSSWHKSMSILFA